MAERGRQYLKERNWPVGLQDCALKMLRVFPIRFVIIDNSGSMVASDGHKLTHDIATDSYRYEATTRWQELIDVVTFQAEFANAASALTEFRLINNAAPIVVGKDEDDFEAVSQVCTLMNTANPTGGTPLCKHIGEIVAQVKCIEAELLESGQKAAIVICTDGKATDGDVAAALKPLHKLPVWVVLRLCTDDNNVVEYWNAIDSQLELDLEILDDIVAEANEIHVKNGWFTYGEPLHLLRQFGINVKELDMLDEKTLTADQVRDVCAIIFGGTSDDYPHPSVNPKEFIRFVSEKNKEESKIWNPVTQTMTPWIEPGRMKELLLADGKCTIA